MKNNGQSNVADETILKHRREVGESKRKLDEAQGVYRASLKRAKADGVDTSAMIEVMTKRKQERDIVVSHYRNVFRYAEAEGSPLVSQLELFPDGAEPAISPEARAEHDDWQAGTYGYEAGKGGQPRADNPHKPGSSTYVAWDDNWVQGQRAVAASMGGGDIEVATAAPRRRGRSTRSSAADLTPAA